MDISETAFFIERKGLDQAISEKSIDSLYTFITAFVVSLIALKVMKKGFWTYILWRDGDPDAPIQQSVVNTVLAVATALAFPTLYNLYAEVSVWLIGRMMSIMLLNTDGKIVIENSMLSLGLVPGIVALIYMIMLFMLYYQLVKRSVELLALRLGFPLACMGLLDSDNGVFATTIKVFVQVSLTTISQLFL